MSRQYKPGRIEGGLYVALVLTGMALTVTGIGALPVPEGWQLALAFVASAATGVGTVVEWRRRRW